MDFHVLSLDAAGFFITLRILPFFGTKLPLGLPMVAKLRVMTTRTTSLTTSHKPSLRECMLTCAMTASFSQADMGNRSDKLGFRYRRTTTDSCHHSAVLANEALPHKNWFRIYLKF